jgi:hypothetical protein
VNDTEIEEALNRAAPTRRLPTAGLLEQIADSVQASLTPVRPLPPLWKQAGTLLAAGMVVALLGAARAGFLGFEALPPTSRSVIFAVLATLWGLTASQVVVAWLPASRRLLPPVAVLLGVSVALLALFWLEFVDGHSERFLSQGVRCLLTGLVHAALAAALGLWIVSRGYAVNPVTAGLILGVLGGLSGVTMLELHCANFETLHVMVWHTLVVPVSGAAGACAGWALRKSQLRKIARAYVR